MPTPSGRVCDRAAPDWIPLKYIHGSIVMLILMLGNGSGTDFGASQCIPIDLDAAADAVCLYP